jgi:hypothetical protein
MGAKAGRKGARSYNILTCGVGAWRKFLDKTRRGTARRAAIEEQGTEKECICGSITQKLEHCKCGCGYCCDE